ncbi:PulJ/GspJ family protein [Heyndrickxia faecalis]|uniref:PulJ/GspJ family protein n=1 Tax=Heyndrickxia faecalis TaxID=2824910 RepID=UPI003D2478AA
MKCRNEKGLTLVELLAAVTISFMIIGVIYAVLNTVITQSKSDMARKNFVKEQTAILQYMNSAMENVDDIEPDDENDDGTFTRFKAVDVNINVGSDGTYQESSTDKTIAVSDGNLSVGGTIVNSDGISLDGTTFTVENGSLICHFVIKDTQNHFEKKIYAAYKLGEEGNP